MHAPLMQVLPAAHDWQPRPPVPHWLSFCDAPVMQLEPTQQPLAQLLELHVASVPPPPLAAVPPPLLVVPPPFETVPPPLLVVPPPPFETVPPPLLVVPPPPVPVSPPPPVPVSPPPLAVRQMPS
jgi:hypothetical protein